MEEISREVPTKFKIDRTYYRCKVKTQRKVCGFDENVFVQTGPEALSVIKSGFKLKYGIGLWKKVRAKDLYECTVKIGTNVLNRGE